MISAVTAQGPAAVLHLHRQLHRRRGSSSSAASCMADTDGPVYLVVDGHPAHRAKLVTRVRRRHRGPAEAVPAARLLPAAQPRRVGLEERQARPGRAHQRHTTPTSSRPRSSVRCDGCRNCPRSSGHSSPTRTCATSPHDQSQLTNDLLSKVTCCAAVKGAGFGWKPRYASVGDSAEVPERDRLHIHANFARIAQSPLS